MGCGRCVVSCPTDALSFRDVRDVLRPGVTRDASYLLGRSPLPSERVKNPVQSVPTQPDPLAAAQAEARRCLDCGEPACRAACPLNNRIPDWLAALASGRVEETARIGHETSSFPEICGRLCPQHRLCEGACARGRIDAPVAIGRLEAYVNDQALERGWRPEVRAVASHLAVAVVGAGPAGLACADVLARAGTEVTVYDRAREIGGLLSSGIPPFKLDRDRVLRRRAVLERMGVRFRLETEVTLATMKRLLDDSHAVFIGTGASRSRRLDIPGGHLPGVLDALAYLAAPDAARALVTGNEMLVLGGGDTAVDCARTAVRQGAAAVTIAYRRSRERMRASPKELAAALDEGIRFCFDAVPVGFIGEKAVEGIRFADGRRTRCSIAIVAIGQEASPPPWLGEFGIEIDAGGHILVDGHGRTANPRVLAGGDNTPGPDLVVTAAAAGRRAAQAILAQFAGCR